MPKLAHHFGPLYNRFKKIIDSHPEVQHKIDALLGDLYRMAYDAFEKVKKDQTNIDYELFEDDR